MLILCYKLYAEQGKRLKKLREKKNFKILLHVVDDSATYLSLQKIVDDYYKKKKKEKLHYLCLIGNENEIPSYKTSYENNAMSDIMYGLKNDIIQIFVGRITSGDSHYLNRSISQSDRIQYVKNQIDKLHEYENISTDSQEWCSNIHGIGSNDGEGYGYENMSDRNFVKKELNKYYKNGCNTYCFTEESTNFNSTLKKGASCVFYVGHGLEDQVGTTGFNIRDVKDLENTHVYSFFIFVACLVGSFDESEICLAEALQICKNGGTICACASTIQQNWTPPMKALTIMNKIINEKLMDDTLKLTFGNIFYPGVQEIFKSGKYYDKESAMTWTLLGDPSAELKICKSRNAGTKNNASSGVVVNKKWKNSIHIVFTTLFILYTLNTLRKKIFKRIF